MTPSDALRQVNDLIADLWQHNTRTREELVELGSILYMMERRAHSQLNVVKDALRDEVRADGITGTVHWMGDDRGRASISVPKPKFHAPKSPKLNDLRAILGAERFGVYFGRKVEFVLRPDIEDVLTEAPAEERALIMEHLELHEGVPRVSFQHK